MIACPGRGSLLSPTLAKLQMSFPTGSSNTLVRVRKLFSQWRFKAPLHCTALHSHAQPPQLPDVMRFGWAQCTAWRWGCVSCFYTRTLWMPWQSNHKHWREALQTQLTAARFLREAGGSSAFRAINNLGRSRFVWSCMIYTGLLFTPPACYWVRLLCRQIWRAMQGCLWRGDKTSQRDAKGDIARREAGFLWHSVIQMIQDRYTLLWQWYMTTTYDNTSWDIWFLHILTLHVITSFWGESSSSDTVARGHPGLLRVGSRTKFRFAKLACQLGLAVQDRRAAAGVVLGQPQLQELFFLLGGRAMQGWKFGKTKFRFPWLSFDTLFCGRHCQIQRQDSHGPTVLNTNTTVVSEGSATGDAAQALRGGSKERGYEQMMSRQSCTALHWRLPRNMTKLLQSCSQLEAPVTASTQSTCVKHCENTHVKL